MQLVTCPLCETWTWATIWFPIQLTHSTTKDASCLLTICVSILTGKLSLLTLFFFLTHEKKVSELKVYILSANVSKKVYEWTFTTARRRSAVKDNKWHKKREEGEGERITSSANCVLFFLSLLYFASWNLLCSKPIFPLALSPFFLFLFLFSFSPGSCSRIDCLVEDALENFAEITRVHLSHNPIRTIGK